MERFRNKVEELQGFKVINRKRYTIVNLIFIVFIICTIFLGNYYSMKIVVKHTTERMYHLDQQNCTITMTMGNKTSTKTFHGLEDMPGTMICLKNQGRWGNLAGVTSG